MNIQSWILLAIVLVALGLTLRRVWKNQKSGKGSCSCCDHSGSCQMKHMKRTPTSHHKDCCRCTPPSSPTDKSQENLEKL